MASNKCYHSVLKAISENSVPILQQTKRDHSELELLKTLEQSNREDQTILGIAMIEGNVCVIEELVTWISQNNVYQKQECMQTIINIVDRLPNQVPMISVIHYLIKELSESDWLRFLGGIFHASYQLNQHDKIIALELIGAFLIISSFARAGILHDQMHIGIVWWDHALIDLRLHPNDSRFTKTPKVILQANENKHLSAVLGYICEVDSVVGIMKLQEECETNRSEQIRAKQLKFEKKMQVQALHVIRRTCLEEIPGLPYQLYLKSLLKIVECVLNQRDYVDEQNYLISLFMILLKELNEIDEAEVFFQLYPVYTNALWLFSAFFNNILCSPRFSPARQNLTYENLLAATETMKTISNVFRNPAVIPPVTIQQNSFPFAVLVYRFLHVLVSISRDLRNEEIRNLEEYFYSFVNNFSASRTTTILHVAVTTHVGRLEDRFSGMLHLGTVKRILKLGADPNSVDAFRRTPLHILAKNNIHGGVDIGIFKALVDAGTHLDKKAEDGFSIRTIVKFMLERHSDSYLKNLMEAVPIGAPVRLTCLAARVIRRNDLNLDRLTEDLQDFVIEHKDVLPLYVRPPEDTEWGAN